MSAHETVNSATNNGPRIEVIDRVAHVVLDRPDRLNARYRAQRSFGTRRMTAAGESARACPGTGSRRRPGRVRQHPGALANYGVVIIGDPQRDPKGLDVDVDATAQRGPPRPSPSPPRLGPRTPGRCSLACLRQRSSNSRTNSTPGNRQQRRRQRHQHAPRRQAPSRAAINNLRQVDWQRAPSQVGYRRRLRWTRLNAVSRRSLRVGSRSQILMVATSMVPL